VSDIFIASCQADNLRSRTKSVPQNGFEDIEVAVADESRPPVLGPYEFREFLRGHKRSPLSLGGQPE
jgi:hypothetical protein